MLEYYQMVTKGKKYITTAIPYVNAAPHIGFAQEIVQTDTLARYYRLLGNEVFFLTGTDENALKNVQAAEKEGITPQELVNKYSQNFKELKTALNLSFDDFIRTTETRHIKGAQKFWKACENYIYKKQYKGLYCVGCEEFKTEKDLENGTCPEHPGNQLEVIEEENYFFKLSEYQDKLKKLIETDTLKIIPDFRKNEVLAFINQGLEDFSISRSKERAKGWGIPVPGDDSQIIYVWFDALINYITALGYAIEDSLYKNFWEDPQTEKVHCLGKGITRFHTIYWPAMLLAAGLPLPNVEFVHGYITINGQKISKSLGNVIAPSDITEKYGTDALRYYLLKVIPPTKDGDFTEKQFIEVYNGELANGLGNTVARVAKLAETSNLEFEPANYTYKQNADIETAWDEFRFDLVLNLIWQKLAELDAYINEKQPWALKDTTELKPVLEYSIDTLREIAVLIEPFMPGTAQKIQEQFKVSRIIAQSPLFPRIQA